MSLERDLERFFDGDFFLVPPGDLDRLFFDFLDFGDLDLLLRRFFPSSPSVFSFSFLSLFGAWGIVKRWKILKLRVMFVVVYIVNIKQAHTTRAQAVTNTQAHTHTNTITEKTNR